MTLYFVLKDKKRNGTIMRRKDYVYEIYDKVTEKWILFNADEYIFPDGVYFYNIEDISEEYVLNCIRSIEKEV